MLIAGSSFGNTKLMFLLAKRYKNRSFLFMLTLYLIPYRFYLCFMLDRVQVSGQG